MKHPKKDEKFPADDRIITGTWTVQGIAVGRTNRSYTPPTDVIEFPDRLVVLVEIAGMRAEDFRLTLRQHKLVIDGVRERPPFDNAAYHQVEIGFGEFRVEVYLPWPVKQDEVNAAYGEGFLQIDLPRRGPETISVVDTSESDNEPDRLNHDR